MAQRGKEMTQGHTVVSDITGTQVNLILKPGLFHYKTSLYSKIKILSVVYNKAFKKMPTATVWLCLARNPPTKEISQYSANGKSVL